MGPYARVDCNLLTLCPFHRVDTVTFAMGKSMPESTLALCQSRLYPVRYFGFGLRFYAEDMMHGYPRVLAGHACIIRIAIL
jgi:hypothetical protein